MKAATPRRTRWSAASPQLGAQRSRSSDRNRDFHGFFGRHHRGFGGSIGIGLDG
jgi:hypothetical protein